MGDWFVWLKPNTAAGSPAPANSPAGGTGPGNSKPAGPQGFGAPSSTVPHPDSPEAKLVSREFVKYAGQHFLLAAQIEAIKNNLDAKAAQFRKQIPPGKLRDLFDAQFAELKKMYDFGQPPGSSAPNSSLIAAKLQTTIGWVDPKVSALLDGVDGAEAVPGKKPTLWEFKTEAEKGVYLVSLDALAGMVFDAATAEVASDLVAAKLAGLVEDKLEEWAVRAAKRIANSIRSRGGAPTDDDNNKKTGPGSKAAKETHWVSVKLLSLPDVSPRKKWWPPAQHLEDPDERFAAELTSGHKEDSLDGSGYIRYNNIPAGECMWTFNGFFGKLIAALTPAKAKPNAKSLHPAPQAPPGPIHVKLTVEKPLLTLKHDNECKLHVSVTPASTVVDDYRIEIKRVTNGQWEPLAKAQQLAPWKAVIAGYFDLRGVATINGGDVFSPIEQVEVQFPEFSQIVADPVVKSAMSALWTVTLNDCTDVPNLRREHGFWISLNTQSNAYEIGSTLSGPLVGPTQGAKISIPNRAADTPPTPSPPDPGATYPVAWFHTHTPTEFRAASYPISQGPNPGRGVGASGPDSNVAAHVGAPGIAYDYVASPLATGAIPMGHPKNAPTQLYATQGALRRATPQ